MFCLLFGEPQVSRLLCPLTTWMGLSEGPFTVNSGRLSGSHLVKDEPQANRDCGRVADLPPAIGSALRLRVRWRFRNSYAFSAQSHLSDSSGTDNR